MHSEQPPPSSTADIPLNEEEATSESSPDKAEETNSTSESPPEKGTEPNSSSESSKKAGAMILDTACSGKASSDVIKACSSPKRRRISSIPVLQSPNCSPRRSPLIKSASSHVIGVRNHPHNLSVISDHPDSPLSTGKENFIRSSSGRRPVTPRSILDNPTSATSIRVQAEISARRSLRVKRTRDESSEERIKGFGTPKRSQSSGVCKVNVQGTGDETVTIQGEKKNLFKKSGKDYD